MYNSSAKACLLSVCTLLNVKKKTKAVRYAYVTRDATMEKIVNYNFLIYLILFSILLLTDVKSNRIHV